MATSTIGSAKSNKFLIGAAEIRIGPLSRAGRLTSNDSVGLLQSATVNYANETVDLEGGLPKTLIDTVIVKQTASVSAQAYEFTTNNLRVMLNAGVGRNNTPDFSFVTSADITSTASSFTYTYPVGTTATVAGTTLSTTAQVMSSLTPNTMVVKDAQGNVIGNFDENSAFEFSMVISGVTQTYTLKPTEISAIADASGIPTLTFKSYTGSTASGTLFSLVAGGTAPIGTNKVPAGTLVKSLGQLDSNVGSEMYEGTLTNSIAVGSSSTTIVRTSIPVGQIKKGHILATYPTGRPGDLTLLYATADATADGIGSQVVCTAGGSGLLFPASTGDIVYRVDDIGLGKNTQTQYFALDVITMDHASGRPTGWRFWKAAVSSGLDFSYSADNFGTTPLSFKILKPSMDDLSGPLSGINDQYNEHPYGIYF